MQTLRLFLTAALTILLAQSASAQTYRILLTNDDGIESPLLATLRVELMRLPDVEVMVSAPSENQSGSSHASGGASLQVDRHYKDGDFIGYAVHGRPADAVRFAITQFSGQHGFDLVVSGINRGANVGDVSHLSGTVGAAMEGIYLGVPAIAVSQDTEGVDTRTTARLAAQVVARYRSQGALEGILVSINVPRGELRGVAVRPMGDSYLKTESYARVAETLNGAIYERQRVIVLSRDSSTDTFAYQNGYATITPLRFDWTARDYIEEVQSWGLSLPDK